jgi:hypothetical protein
MTYAERAEKRARAIYEAALSSTLMQQESTTAAGVVCEFDFDVALRETLVRMVAKELQNGTEWRRGDAASCSSMTRLMLSRPR